MCGELKSHLAPYTERFNPLTQLIAEGGIQIIMIGMKGVQERIIVVTVVISCNVELNNPTERYVLFGGRSCIHFKTAYWEIIGCERKMSRTESMHIFQP